MKLNARQEEAVCHGSGPLLIIAGAGSGKTRVITHRIAFLIEEKGISPNRILALTFSNNAAEEMRQRLESLLSKSFEELWIGTFHSFCAEILRENALDFGINPFFQILTESEQLLLLANNLEKLDLQYFELKGRPFALLSQLVWVINRAKDEMITAEDYERHARELKGGDEGEIDKIEEVARVYRFYQELIFSQDSLDFGDLILTTLNLFKEKPHILARYQQQFQYILVDEFQDTNFAQSFLLDMLAQKHQNICVVGDDDQGIYRFRGATLKNIQDFQKRYPRAKIVRLEENYRSTPQILDAAYAVIRHNKAYRLEKRLVPVKNELKEQSVVIAEAKNLSNQSEFVAKTIAELLTANKDLNPSEIAILCSSVKGEAAPFVKALEEHNIPCWITETAGFFERTEVRDIIAWMRIIVDPFDQGSLHRILESAPLRVNPLDVSRLGQYAREKRLPLMDVLGRLDKVEGLSPETPSIVTHFLKVYRSLLKKREEFSADRLLREVLDRIGYREYLLLFASLENLQKLANLAKLEEIARGYVSRVDATSLKGFIDYLNLIMAGDIREESLNPCPLPEAVQIMTIHKSKGLEFEVVFLVNLTDSKMPGSRRKEQLEIPRGLLKEELPDNLREIHEAEKRRLFYVACTRAKDNLYLCYSLKADQLKRVPKKSRFLEEIIADLGLEPLEVEETYGVKVHPSIKESEEKYQSLAQALTRGTDILLGDLDDNGALSLLQEQLRYFFELKKVQLAKRSKDLLQAEKAFARLNRLVEVLFQPPFQKELQDLEGDQLLLQAVGEESKFKERVQLLRNVSHRNFLPLVNGGLNLTVSEIIAYRNCPLSYKFRVIDKIPVRPGVEQEFGIFMHDVLQQFHSNFSREKAKLEDLSLLFEKKVKVSRFGWSRSERQYLEKARAILPAYFGAFKKTDSTPRYLEHKFHWHLAPHWVRGRVDRVDQLSGGGFELIDYKTGKKWDEKKVKEDLQLSIYSLGARESWGIEPEFLSYYFILDNEKTPVSHTSEELEHAKEIVLEVAENILAGNFEPKEDYIVCRYCDYYLLCPAKERR